MKTKGLLILFCTLFWASAGAQKPFQVPSTSYGVPINNPEEIKLITAIFNAPDNVSGPRLSSQYGVPTATQKTTIPQQVYSPPQERVVVPHALEQQTASVPKPIIAKTVIIPQTKYGVPQNRVQVPQTTNGVRRTYAVPQNMVEVPPQTTYLVPQTTYDVPQQYQNTVEVPQTAYLVLQTAYVVPQQDGAIANQQLVPILVPHTIYDAPPVRIEVVPVKPQLAYGPPTVKRPPVLPAQPARFYGLDSKVVVPQFTYRVPQQVLPIPANEYSLAGRRAPINIVQRYTQIRSNSPPINPSFDYGVASLKPVEPVRLANSYGAPNAVKELVPHTTSNVIVTPAREYGL